jgi:hypothetical protein
MYTRNYAESAYTSTSGTCICRSCCCSSMKLGAVTATLSTDTTKPNHSNALATLCKRNALYHPIVNRGHMTVWPIRQESVRRWASAPSAAMSERPPMYVHTWVALAEAQDCIVRHILAAAQAQHLEGRQAFQKHLDLQARAPGGVVKAEAHGAAWHQHAGIA